MLVLELLKRMVRERAVPLSGHASIACPMLAPRGESQSLISKLEPALASLSLKSLHWLAPALRSLTPFSISSRSEAPVVTLWADERECLPQTYLPCWPFRRQNAAPTYLPLNGAQKAIRV